MLLYYDAILFIFLLYYCIFDTILLSVKYNPFLGISAILLDWFCFYIFDLSQSVYLVVHTLTTHLFDMEFLKTQYSVSSIFKSIFYLSDFLSFLDSGSIFTLMIVIFFPNEFFCWHSIYHAMSKFFKHFKIFLV